MQQRCKTKLHQEKVALQGFLGEEALSAHCPQSLDVIKCKEKVVETQEFWISNLPPFFVPWQILTMACKRVEAPPFFSHDNIIMI